MRMQSETKKGKNNMPLILIIFTHLHIPWRSEINLFVNVLSNINRSKNFKIMF